MDGPCKPTLEQRWSERTRAKRGAGWQGQDLWFLLGRLPKKLAQQGETRLSGDSLSAIKQNVHPAYPALPGRKEPKKRGAACANTLLNDPGEPVNRSRHSPFARYSPRLPAPAGPLVAGRAIRSWRGNAGQNTVGNPLPRGSPQAQEWQRRHLALVVPGSVAQFGVIRNLHPGTRTLDPRFAEQQPFRRHAVILFPADLLDGVVPRRVKAGWALRPHHACQPQAQTDHAAAGSARRARSAG